MVTATAMVTAMATATAMAGRVLDTWLDKPPLRDVRFTVRMTGRLGQQLAAICRDRRIELGVTQVAIARALEISRSHYAAIEAGTANPSIALVDRIGEILGVQFLMRARDSIVIPGPRTRDALHARCSGYVARRLRSAGWIVQREVEISDGRLRGWIDLLAYDPVTATLLIIEVKTGLDDVGRLERQLGWYARIATRVAPADWVVRAVGSWALLLATSDVDEAIARNAQVLGQALPDRAISMRRILSGAGVSDGHRGLALIDPNSRRRDWLIATRVDGRRSPLPYQDRGGAARILHV